jgi:hypothetical protein
VHEAPSGSRYLRRFFDEPAHNCQQQPLEPRAPSARESRSGHLWSSDGTEPARGRAGGSIGRNWPMADKEMIAATLAAGVLAAAPRD